MLRAAVLLSAAVSALGDYEACPADNTHYRRLELDSASALGSSTGSGVSLNEWYSHYLGTGRMVKLTCLRGDGLEVKIVYAKVASAAQANKCNTTSQGMQRSCSGGNLVGSPNTGLMTGIAANAVDDALCAPSAKLHSDVNSAPACQENFAQHHTSCQCIAVGDTNGDQTLNTNDIVMSRSLTPAKNSGVMHQATPASPFWYKAHGTDTYNFWIVYKHVGSGTASMNTKISLSFVAEAKMPDADWCVSAMDAKTEIDGYDPVQTGLADSSTFPRHFGFQFVHGADGQAVVGGQIGMGTTTGNVQQGGNYYYWDLGTGPMIDIECLHLFTTLPSLPATVDEKCTAAQYGLDGQMNPVMDMNENTASAVNGIADLDQENYDVHLVDAYNCDAYTMWTELGKVPYKLYVRTPNVHQDKAGDYVFTGQYTMGMPIWKKQGTIENGWNSYYMYLAPTESWFIAPSSSVGEGTDFTQSSGFIASLQDRGPGLMQNSMAKRMPHQITRWQYSHASQTSTGVANPNSWTADSDISVSSTDGTGFVQFDKNRLNTSDPALSTNTMVAGRAGHAERATCCFQKTQQTCADVAYDNGNKACFWNGQAGTCHLLKTMAAVSLKKGVLGVDNSAFSFASYAVHGPRSSYISQKAELGPDGWEGSWNRRWFLRIKNKHVAPSGGCGSLQLTASWRSNTNGGTCEPGARQQCEETETHCLVRRVTTYTPAGTPDASRSMVKYWGRHIVDTHKEANYNLCNCLKEKEICYRKSGCVSTKKYQLILQNCLDGGCGNFCNSGVALRAGIQGLVAALIAVAASLLQ